MWGSFMLPMRLLALGCEYCAIYGYEKVDADMK
jgi:hypothetical protein